MSIDNKSVLALLTGTVMTLASSLAFADNVETKTVIQKLLNLDASYLSQVESGLLPPNAKPGECYARAYIPSTESVETRRFLSKEATEKLQIVPAVYEWVDETVEVATEAAKLEIIPAKYENRTTTIVVEPEKTRRRIEPAVYETVVERIKVRDAYTTWKKGAGPIQRYDDATGEIMCLVTVPAEFKERKKQVIKTPPRVVTETIPAKTKTVTVRTMVERPRTVTKVIPAKSQTVKVHKLVNPASVRRVKIPAVYENYSEVVAGKAGGMEWRPILCETNASKELVTDLQVKLQKLGHYPGPIDGIIGRNTMAGVRIYQKAKGLATGEITLETLKSLGVKM